jgi:DNA-binding PadR family transcriptional regulator
MASSKELMGASTGLLVLGVLSRAPNYGYEIVRTVNDEARGLLVWQEGTLYPILHKLEKQGLVRAQWQETDSGRQRKYYYITAAGRSALRQDVQQWSAVNVLVLKLAGASHG